MTARVVEGEEAVEIIPIKSPAAITKLMSGNTAVSAKNGITRLNNRINPIMPGTINTV